VRFMVRVLLTTVLFAACLWTTAAVATAQTITFPMLRYTSWAIPAMRRSIARRSPIGGAQRCQN